MAKRTYTPQHWSLAAAGCFFGVLVGVLMPWYATTVAVGHEAVRTDTINGFEGPFLGVWAVVLAGVGALLAGAVGVKVVRTGAAKPVLGLGAIVYLVAWVLTLVDMFREVPEGVSLYGTASSYKLYGMYPASVGALLGVFMIGGALKAFADAPEAAPAPPPPPPPPAG